VLGLAGGLVGGFIFNATSFRIEGKMIYTSVSAILGAIILTFLSRYFLGRREYGATD
jgi:uncharacterized membrane protein YeaQ/YmgE (transglycosylase-associated protein family)